LLHRSRGAFRTTLEVNCEDLRTVPLDLVVPPIQLDQLISTGWSPVGSREYEHEFGFTPIVRQVVPAPS
jgi:hypothetical protein